MTIDPDKCETCPEHKVTDRRLLTLEEKLTVVEKNSAIVNKLSVRVSMLITLISIGTLTVLGGSIYTFTAVSKFRSDYTEHRIEMMQHMNESQKEMLAVFTQKMEGMERRIEDKMDSMGQKINTLEHTVEGTKPSKQYNPYK